jgi:L-threonate 2-dehydrogenase
MSEPIGVIGVGNMGAAMAARLLDRGFAVHVRDVRADAEAPLVAQGARREASPRTMTRNCAVILVVVVDANQIEEVLNGKNGLLPGLQERHVVLFQSTIAPADAAGLVQAAAARGARALDAPISGGPARARAGQLSIMVAGADAAIAQAQPVLDALAKRVFRVGNTPGLGATMKLVNNLLAGAYLAAGAEAFAIGRAAGLEGQTMAKVFAASSGQSWILDDRLARLLAGDGERHAQMHILAKDLRLAVELAQSVGKQTTLGAATRALFAGAIADGLAESDDSALVSWVAR